MEEGEEDSTINWYSMMSDGDNDDEDETTTVTKATTNMTITKTSAKGGGGCEDRVEEGRRNNKWRRVGRHNNQIMGRGRQRLLQRL